MRKSHAAVQQIEHAKHAQTFLPILLQPAQEPCRPIARGNAIMRIFETDQSVIHALLEAGVLKMSNTIAPQTHSPCLFHGIKTTARASLDTSEMGH
jgi:hypothetical protein